MAPIRPIQKTSSVMSTTPGWVNSLAGGVPGAVAAYDFVNQLYWQQGNPSGNFIVQPTNVSNLGLANTTSGSSQGVLQLPVFNTPFSIVLRVKGVTDISSSVLLEKGAFEIMQLYAASNTTVQFKNGAPTITATAGSGNFSGEVVIACGCDLNGRSIAANGGSVASDANGGLYLMGEYMFLNTYPPNPGGHTLSVVFWPSRLSDATLQGLT